MYKRTEYQTIRDRLEDPRRFIQVVMGARQIGKTTVVKQVLNDLKASARKAFILSVPKVKRLQKSS